MKLKITQSLLMLVFVLTCLNSCKKEITISADKKYRDLIRLGEAKVFFENEVLSNSPLTLNKKDLSANEIIANENVDFMLYKEPLWEKAYRKSLNGKFGIAVPIHFKVRSFIRTGEKKVVDFEKLNYLLISRNEKGSLQADWVTLAPDIDWIKGNRKVYTGRIKVADWDGNLKKVYSFDKEGKMLSYKKSVNESLLLSSWTNASQLNSFGGNGKIMSIPNALGDTPGRKYKDANGECWENLVEISGYGGVTLVRRRIDCAELEPEVPGGGVDDGDEPGSGNGGGGGNGGGQQLVPKDCNDDPTYDPSLLPPLSGGLEYMPKCEIPIEEEPEPESEPDCVKVKQQSGSAAYKQKATELNDKVGLKKESGFEERKDGSFNAATNANDNSLNAPVDANTRGFMHTHQNDYQIGDVKDDGTVDMAYPIRMFSPADVNTLMRIVNENRNSNDFSAYYVSMISSTGHYMIKFNGTVNDIKMGMAGGDWPNRYKAFMNRYTNLEKGFLKFLKEEMGINGVQLFEIKNNGEIKKINLNPDNRSISRIGC